MRIALVVGHAKDKQGAWGSAGYSEYKFWSKFTKDLMEMSEVVEMGHDTDNEIRIFKRPTSKRGYSSRMKLLHANLDDWGADVAISFHFNAAANQRVDGHEVLYCSKGGKRLAKRMNDIFNTYLPNRDRGIKKKRRSDRGGGFLCRGRSTCILVEPYFAAEQIYFTKQGYDELLSSFLDFLETL